MIHLDSLAVTGDVYFGRNVTLRGTVISEHNCISIGITLAIIDYFYFILFRLVVAKEGQKIYVPDGCIIENSMYQLSFPSFHHPDEHSLELMTGCLNAIVSVPSHRSQFYIITLMPTLSRSFSTLVFCRFLVYFVVALIIVLDERRT